LVNFETLTSAPDQTIFVSYTPQFNIN